MTYVITDLCTKCLKCPPTCPVDCIHPSEGEADLDAVQHLNVNPDECISCGACTAECPSDAIFEEGDLPADKKQFLEENAKYFK